MKKIKFVKSEISEYIYYTNVTSDDLELVFRLGEIEIETAPGIDNIVLDLMIYPSMFIRKRLVRVVIDEELSNIEVDDDVLRYDSMQDFVVNLVFRNLAEYNITYNSDRFSSQYDYSEIIDGITERNGTNMSIFDAMVMFLSNIGNNVILQKYFKFIYHYLRFYKPEIEELEGQLLFYSKDSEKNKLVVSDKLNIEEFNNDKIVKILSSVLHQPMKLIEQYLGSINDSAMKIEPMGEVDDNLDPMHEILKIMLNKDMEQRTTFVPVSHLNIRGYGFGVIHGFPIHCTQNENLDTIIYCIEKNYYSELFTISETVFDKDMKRKGEIKEYGVTDIEIYEKLPSNIRTNLLRFNDLLKNLYSTASSECLIKVLSKNLSDMTLYNSDNSLRDGSVSFGFSFDNELLTVTPTVNPLIVDHQRFCSLMTDGGVLFKKKYEKILMNNVTGDNVDDSYILRVLCKIYDIMDSI